VDAELRLAVLERDGRNAGGCVGWGRLPGECVGRLTLDHVRSSGALGKKSRTTLDNLVTLCIGHHQYKTEHGREARPILLHYLERFDYSVVEDLR